MGGWGMGEEGELGWGTGGQGRWERGAGGCQRASRASAVKFQTAISWKQLKITLSICTQISTPSPGESDKMGVLGAAIARCRMICMGLPVQGKQTQWR